MNTIKRTDKWRGAWLALLAAALLFWPATALALTNNSAADPIALCSAANAASTDTDGDGFTDAQECNGIVTVGFKNIAGFNSTDATIPVADRLDPTRADLFYLLSNMLDADLTAGSLLFDAVNRDPNKNALKFYKDGLIYLRTHYLTSDYCGTDRLITTNPSTGQAVRAVRIKEQVLTTVGGTDIGKTQPSTPSTGNVFSIVYTTKIKDSVNTSCPTPGKCTIKGTSIINTVSNQPIIDYYILQVASHEMGHGSKLGAAGYADTNGHYTKSGTIMDGAATFKTGIYTIPVAFYPDRDFGAVALK